MNSNRVLRWLKLALPCIVMVGNVAFAQKAKSPFLGEQIYSPFEYRSRQIQELANACDSLELLGITDSTLLIPLLELTQKFISFNPIQGLKAAEKGIELAEKWGYKALLCSFHSCKAGIFRYRGYRDLALASYLKSFELSSTLPSKEFSIFGLIDIGNIYYDQRSYETALLYYGRAQDSAIAAGSANAQAVALNNMGIVYRDQEQYAIAEKLFERSAEVRTQNKLYGQDAHSKHYIAGLCMRTGDYHRGLSIIQSVIDTMEHYQMYSELVDAYSNKARLLGYLKRYKEAESSLNQANAILLQHSMVDKLEYYLLSRAYVASIQGNLKAADDFINQQLKLADDFDNLQGKRRGYTLRYEIYKKAGQYKKALEALEGIQLISLETDRQEVDRKLLEMEQASVLAQKEKELLERTFEIQQQSKSLAAVRVRNQLLIALVLFALLALLVIGALYVKQQQTNQALEESERVIRLNNLEIAARNEQLQASQKQTEQLLQAKSEFLSQMSHEIRTPMNSIVGLTDLLMEEVKNAEGKDKLQSIKFAADLLLAIINDILDLSAIEEGKLNLQLAPTPLYRLGRELLNQLEHIAQHKGIELDLVIHPNVPTMVMSDATRLFQILLNLCSNAVKFTETGKVLVNFLLISHENDSCVVRFEIIDTGIGIAPEEVKNIFERFSQANHGIHRKYGGTGLGLTITQRLVSLLGGNGVKVKTTLGKGSNFYFELPFKIAVEPVEIAPSSKKAKLHLTNANGQKIKIFYAEDNLMNQKVMTMMLTEIGITTVLANHGLEALKRLSEETFDMVLLDIRMPHMDGFETARSIRAGDYGVLQPQIPIIGVSADVLNQTDSEAFKAGMNDVIQKPLLKTQLIDLLSKYFYQSNPLSNTSNA